MSLSADLTFVSALLVLSTVTFNAVSRLVPHVWLGLPVLLSMVVISSMSANPSSLSEDMVQLGQAGCPVARLQRRFAAGDYKVSPTLREAPSHAPSGE